MYGLSNQSFPDHQFHEARHGVLCHVATDQLIGASLRMYGEWAEEELWLLSHLIQPGDTVLDLGANIGTHSLAFSRFTGPNGLVIAIDAQRRAFRLLCLNMLLNQADWVTPINALVGATPSLRMLPEINQSNENWGAVSYAAIDQQADAGDALLLPLPIVSIDSLRLRRCSLVKMDIEGMEYDALQGATDLLNRLRPAVYFEQTTERNFAAIYRIFNEFSYDLFWHVTRPFNVANFRHNHRNIFGDTREVNVLALPRERVTQNELLPYLTFRVQDAKYAPPLATVDAHSWILPANAYNDLAQPTSYRSETHPT
jgi:FkbM family methyltransferase